jgi:hypothetical protein
LVSASRTVPLTVPVVPAHAHPALKSSRQRQSFVLLTDTSLHSEFKSDRVAL